MFVRLRRAATSSKPSQIGALEAHNAETNRSWPSSCRQRCKARGGNIDRIIVDFLSPRERPQESSAFSVPLPLPSSATHHRRLAGGDHVLGMTAAADARPRGLVRTPGSSRSRQTEPSRLRRRDISTAVLFARAAAARPRISAAKSAVWVLRDAFASTSGLRRSI